MKFAYGALAAAVTKATEQPLKRGSFWEHNIPSQRNKQKYSPLGQLEKLDFVICGKSCATFDVPGFCCGPEG